MRFTKKNRQQTLDQNEGFQTTTHYSGKNFRETRDYTVEDGGLTIRSRGKTSWADSRFDETSRHDADDEVTKRFLRENRDQLNTDGLK